MSEVRVVIAKRGVVFAKELEAVKAKRVAGRVKYLGTLEQYGRAASWREIFPPFTRAPDVKKAQIMTVEEFKEFLERHNSSLKRRLSEKTMKEIMRKVDELVEEAKRKEPWRPRGKAEVVAFKSSLKPYIKRLRTSRCYVIAETKNYYMYQCDDEFYLFLKKMSDEEVLEHVKELEKYVEDMEHAKGFIEEYEECLHGFEDAIEYLDKVMSMIRLLR